MRDSFQGCSTDGGNESKPGRSEEVLLPSRACSLPATLSLSTVPGLLSKHAVRSSANVQLVSTFMLGNRHRSCTGRCLVRERFVRMLLLRLFWNPPPSAGCRAGTASIGHVVAGVAVLLLLISAVTASTPGTSRRLFAPNSKDKGTVRDEVRRELVPASSGAPASLISPEVAALLAFKRRVRDPGGQLASWQVPRSERDPAYRPGFFCSWKGITCDPRNTTVTQIAVNNPDGNQCLWGLKQVPSVPPELGNLTALQSLDLSYNGQCTHLFGGLTGSIPRELSKCTRLTSLLLTYNALSGTLGNLAKIKSLAELQISKNRFSGTVPSSFSSLTALTRLDLSYNNIEGPLPGWISRLSSLEELKASSTSLSGSIPAELGSLSGLTRVALESNPLISGTIPDGLSTLANLQYLKLFDMDLRGSLPAWLSTLTALTGLVLTQLGISGTLPPALGSKVSLVQISSCKVSGSIPASLIRGLCSHTGIDAVTGFNVSGNNLTGEFPHGLSACSALDTLDLSGNRVGTLFPNMSFFSTMASLQYAKFSRMGLSGSIPRNLFNLAKFTRLEAGFNNLTGLPPIITCSEDSVQPSPSVFVYLANNQLVGTMKDALSEVQKCTGGFSFDLSYNKISGAFLPGVIDSATSINLVANKLKGPIPAPTKCPNLQSLYLENNMLSGAIPPSLFRLCANVTDMNLSNNQLSGPLPSYTEPVKSAPLLKRLVLSRNRITGRLPAGLLGMFRSLSVLDVSHNAISGLIPAAWGSFGGLRSLNGTSNNLQGAIPGSLARLTMLTVLALSSNNLSGDIPQELAPPNLRMLTLLDLSNNKLSGTIPYGFTNVSGNLTVNFANNNLSGPIPGGEAGTLSSNPEALANNPYLCGGAQYPSCPEPSAGSSLSAGAIAGIVVGAVTLLLSAVVAGVCWWHVRPRDDWSHGTMLVFRVFKEPLRARSLVDATENFNAKYLIGRGGFGSVYRVVLPDGTEGAMKRLALESSQGDEEFKAELQTLGCINHRNLVTLVAAYVATPPSMERLLVYEMMPGGSLDKILLEEMPEDSPFRFWKQRKEVMMDIARGLKYLHHDCLPPIIHRDMKPANVLLDDQLVAKVSDFGLAKEADVTRTHMTGKPFGTPGYVAPEYSIRGRLSLKSDVYAFGVTLLQIITGRDTRENAVVERGLQRWVGTSAAAEIVDSNIVDAKEHMDEVMSAVKLGILCIERLPCDRPTMAEVVHILENLKNFAKGCLDVKII